MASGRNQPGPQSSARLTLSPEHLLHRGDAVEEVRHAALADLPLVHGAVVGRRLPHPVVEVGHRRLHVRVEADPLLHHEELFGPLHHPLDVGGIVLRPVAGALLPDRAVVDPDLVAHLAAEELVDRHPGRLAGDVPERVLDRAHRRAVGLERAALADAQHHPLDVGGVLADERVTEMQHPGLEVALGELDLAEAVEALVGDDADDRMPADHGAAQVGDLHAVSPEGSRRALRAAGGGRRMAGLSRRAAPTRGRRGCGSTRWCRRSRRRPRAAAAGSPPR